MRVRPSSASQGHHHPHAPPTTSLDPQLVMDRLARLEDSMNVCVSMLLDLQRAQRQELAGALRRVYEHSTEGEATRNRSVDIQSQNLTRQAPSHSDLIDRSANLFRRSSSRSHSKRVRITHQA